MNFNDTLEMKRRYAESILNVYLPEAEGYEEKVLDAMQYAAMSGGKRLRPVLMKECYKLFGGKERVIEPFMAAIEMIHNYSLIHDDLPAMDNDELRRGRETVWKKYGEAMAILAGDALLNYAFETASGAFDMVKTQEDYPRIAKALKILSEKAGVRGMIGGQTVDVLSENDRDVSKEKLLYIHKNKTAALIEASMMIGAVLAGGSDKDIADMERAGEDIGIAFQIQDDILDMTGTTEELGKETGSDEKNAKQTYVRLHGLEESQATVKSLSEEAILILQDTADEQRTDASFLMTLTETLINRRK
ncbi:MAG: polyprenyl synthetase family protein [Lachnospiraceae bacterium]|nr:polyprenyl synthetase family protein [Lachnospiraceae bacterium]